MIIEEEEEEGGDEDFLREKRASLMHRFNY
jgi:hypothetical protein